MPSTKSYRQLHEQVAARPGAERRLSRLRKQTLAEMRGHKFRQAASQVLEAGSDHREPVGGGRYRSRIRRHRTISSAWRTRHR